MGDVNIIRQSFEGKIAEIKRLSDQVPSDSAINTFKTEGALFKHRVRGEEINENLVKPLQDKFTSINTHILTLFGLNRKVYETLNFLDKRYIDGILLGLEEAKLASGQAKTASEKAETASSQALDASHKALEAQEKISQTINALKLTVEKLQEFKKSVEKDVAKKAQVKELSDKVSLFQQQLENSIKNEKRIQQNIDSLQQLIESLESLPHLNDLDNVWEDVQEHKSDLSSVHQQISDITSKAAETTKSLTANIAALQSFQKLIETYSHLKDVDAVWEDVQGHKSDLSSMHQQISEITSKAAETTKSVMADLAALQSFQQLIESYSHLKDVDTMWEDVQGHKSDLNSVHQQISDITSKAAETTKSVMADLAALQSFQQQIETYSHLKDVDAVWEDVQGHKSDLNSVHQQISDITSKAAETTKSVMADLAALQSFQQQIETYSHLKDVDAVWEDVQGHKSDLNSVHQQISDITSKAAETTKSVMADLAALQSFQKLIETYSHLKDVDAVWEDVQGHKSDLNSVYQQISDITSKAAETTKSVMADLAALQSFQQQIETYSHLKDVDAVWEDVQGHKSDLNSVYQQISDITSKAAETTKSVMADLAALQSFQQQIETYSHLKDVDAVWEDVQGHKSDLMSVHQQISEIEDENKERECILNKKLRIAYCIAGGSIALTIVHMILNYFGIL